MRLLVLTLISLPLVACQSSSDGDVTHGDAGTLLIQAFGGTSGQVAVQIPLLEPGAGPQQSCASPMVAGACQLTSCTSGGIGLPGPGYGNFGPISATVGTSTVPVTYDGTGYPTVYFPSSVTLGTGGIMTFRGGGAGGIPSFDVSATIPGVALLTSPPLEADGGGAVIDTSKDLSVQWAPIPIGQVHFTLTPAVPESAGDPWPSIACTFGGAAGSGIVPQALLASMKKGVGSGATFGNVESEVSTTTSIDGLTIETESYQPGNAGDFAVTLE